MIRLLELRAEKELSQRAVAKEMCISQGTYNNWENGKTQPSIEQLITLSKFFGVTVDYLIGNAEDYEVTSNVDNLTKEQKDIINKIYKLSKPAKKALLDFLDNL